MSNKNPLEDKLLNIKKAKFLEAVERTAKKIHVPIPHVKFWDCPYTTESHIAHIHPEMMMICISEKRLSEMTYEEIEDTASHEVEHLRDEKLEYNPDHSNEFYNRHDKTKKKLWIPGPGIIITTGNEKLKKYRKPKPSKPDKTVCNNYQICKVKTGLKQCQLCKKFFVKTTYYLMNHMWELED